MSPAYDDEFHFNPGTEGLDHSKALAMWEALQRTRRALRAVEWSDDRDTGPFCQACRAEKLIEKGHARGCIVAAALKGEP